MGDSLLLVSVPAPFEALLALVPPPASHSSPQGQVPYTAEPLGPLLLPPPQWAAQPLLCRAQASLGGEGCGRSARVSAGTAELFNPGPEESDSCLSCLVCTQVPPCLCLLALVLLCPPGLRLSKSTCLAPVRPHKSVLPAPLPCPQDMSQPASPTTALPPQETHGVCRRGGTGSWRRGPGPPACLCGMGQSC